MLFFEMDTKPIFKCKIMDAMLMIFDEGDLHGKIYLGFPNSFKNNCVRVDSARARQRLVRKLRRVADKLDSSILLPPKTRRRAKRTR